MSLPPATVQIKRKATDEPLDILRVHESNGKRLRRATDFVFSRQPAQWSTSSSPAPEAVRRIKQLHRAGSSPSLDLQLNQDGTKPDQNVGQADSQFSSAPPADSISQQTSTNDISPTSLKSAELRRFHISRSSTPTSPHIPATGRVQKRSTVFVERKSRPSSSYNRKPATQAHPQASTPKGTAVFPQKKPGRASRIPSGPAKDAPALLSTVPPTTEVRLPSGIMMPWDVNSEQLAAEMQAYTLQEIGHTLAQSAATNPAPEQHSPRKAIQSRFKPKKPALRYQERHPNEHYDSMDTDEPLVYDEDMDDDGDYIIDTYIRMPAHEIDADAEKNFGLLVLDSQPDIDEFYRDDSDHEEQENDEEEDENAEDHYTADYPDDEVESDDEYGRNAYNYRNRNASDLEEFDEDDATFSDEEGDAMRYPWAKQPAWLKNKKLDDDSETEDVKHVAVK